MSPILKAAQGVEDVDMLCFPVGEAKVALEEICDFQEVIDAY